MGENIREIQVLNNRNYKVTIKARDIQDDFLRTFFRGRIRAIIGNTLGISEDDKKGTMSFDIWSSADKIEGYIDSIRTSLDTSGVEVWHEIQGNN